MVDQIISEIKSKMQAALEVLKSDLAKIRTGRANPAILDGIMVLYYGTKTPLKEVTTINVPEPSQIAIKPWDRNILSEVESAIRNSDLGLSPVNDGVQIRLSLPSMTEDRRKEIVETVKKSGEQTKVALRNIRGEAWTKIQLAVKNKSATEDDKYEAEEKFNKLVGEMNQEVDKITAEKEAEVMKI